MRTLIIYDNEGFIISQIGGNVREPVGVPFLWVEVPQGKYITGIDVSGKEHVPVFVEHPKTEVDLLKEQVQNLNIAIAEIIGV